MEYVFLSNIIRKYIKGKSPDNNVFLFSKNDVEVSYLTPEYLRGIGSPIQVKNQKSFVWVEDGDIIILWDGSNAGEILKGKNGVLPSTMVKLLIFNDYYKEYVFYLLKFNEYKFKGKTQGSGIPHANKDEIERVKIYKIDFNEQSKIAEILMTIDDAIEKTERIIAKYRHIKQGLLQDLLTKGIDENGNIRSEATHKFKDSPLGRIPVEWEVKKIGDICKVKGGKRLPKGEKFSEEKFGYPYIRVTDFRNNSVDIKNIEYISQEVREVIKNYTISKEDVYISIAGTIGLVGTIPDCLDGANLTENAAKIMINDKKQVDKNFLVNTILFHGKKQIESSIGITSQPKLALFRIEQIFVVVPQIDEQRAIVDKFLKMNSLIDNEEDILVKLYSIKQGLMQDLLTGKVRVTHLLDKGGKSDECHP